jgi:spore germination cell wall hydrolase CwlJ-like protein
MSPSDVSNRFTIRIALNPLELVPRILQATPVSRATTTSEAVEDLLTEYHCLSEVMYYEARGEGEEGERAVAEVVFDRLAQRHHGKTICDVVYEAAGKSSCQFSFTCDGSIDRPKDRKAWRAAEILAARILARELGQFRDVEGATHYHAAGAHPSWASEFDETAKIGNHIFYRAKAVTGNSPGG